MKLGAMSWPHHTGDSMTGMNVSFVDQLCAASSESQHLEFKEAKSSFDKGDLRDYCVALANEGGGFLLLGVSDTVIGGARAVVGTQAFRKPIELEHFVLQTCRFRIDVGEVSHPHGRVLVFSIPGRPKGIAYESNGRYLMRAGSSLVAMSPDRLKQIFAEDAPHWGEELVRERIQAQDVVDLFDIQRFFELLKFPYPTTQEGVIERLRQKRLVRHHHGTYDITRLGALLLAKRLEDFPEIARRAARVVVYQGSTKLQTRIDQVGQRGYAAGFQLLVNFIMTQMPRREVVESSLRREETLVPEIVIRELVANALVHQELSIGGTSPLVEIYDDRIEISNPGTPIVYTNRFTDGYQSRNEHMAELMRSFGICEEKGSGIDRVITAAEE